MFDLTFTWGSVIDGLALAGMYELGAWGQRRRDRRKARQEQERRLAAALANAARRGA